MDATTALIVLNLMLVACLSMLEARFRRLTRRVDENEDACRARVATMDANNCLKQMWATLPPTNIRDMLNTDARLARLLDHLGLEEVYQAERTVLRKKAKAGGKG